MPIADLVNDISQILPTPFIELITLDSGRAFSAKDYMTKVSINLSLKDIVEKDGISQWFLEDSFQEDLKKYITVHCLLFTEESAYNSFYSLNDSNYTDIQNFIQKYKKNIVEKTITIPTKEELKLNKGAFYSENYITDNEDGTKQLTIPLFTRFDDIPPPVNFMGLVVFLTFNIQDFANNFNVNFNAFGINNFLSIYNTDNSLLEKNALSKAITSETIISNGKIVSESKYFILPNGDFYFGQFHVVDINGDTVYKTGTAETSDSQILTLVTDVNNKIQDFRRRFIPDEKNAFSGSALIDASLQKDLLIQKVIDKNKSITPEYSKYFSNIFTSLDESGNCKFSFFFDKQKFALENCFYPLFINKTFLANQFIIKNISVYRIRQDIKEINDTSENKDVFICANHNDEQQQVDVLSAPDPLLDNNTSYICENAVQNIDGITIKNYSVFDSQVSNLNYGIYKYKIKIDMIDPTKEHLKEKLYAITGYKIATFTKQLKIEGILGILESYFDLAQSNKEIKSSTYSNPYTNKNYNLGIGNIIGDAKIQQNTKFVPYFDVLLGKFINDFSIEKKAQIQKAQSSVTDFFNIAKQFGYFVFSDPVEEKESYDSLIKYVTPEQGATPDSILIMIQVVKEFVTKVKMLLGIADFGAPANIFSKINNILSLEYTFNVNYSTGVNKQRKLTENYFDASIVNGSGFKVVDAISDEIKSGLNTVKLQDYKKLTDNISKKYFKDFTALNIKEHYGNNVDDVYDYADAFDNDNSKYFCLPISYINVYDQKYDLNNLKTTFFDQKYYENILLDILNFNTLGLSSFNLQSISKESSLNKNEQIVKSKLLNLFTYSEFPNISLEKIAYEQKKDFEPKQQAPIDIFGQKANASPTSNLIDDQSSKKNDTTLVLTTDLNSNPNSLLYEILLYEIMSRVNIDSTRDFEIFSPVNESGEKNTLFFLD